MAGLEDLEPIDGEVREKVDNDGRRHREANARLSDGRIVSMYQYDNGETALWFFTAEGEVETSIELEQNRVLRDSDITVRHDGFSAREFRDRDVEQQMRVFADQTFTQGRIADNADVALVAFEDQVVDRSQSAPAIIEEGYSDILESHTAFVAVDRDGIDVSILRDYNGASIFLMDDQGNALGEIHTFNAGTDVGGLNGSVVIERADGSTIFDFESMLDEQTLNQVRQAFADGRVTNEEATMLASVVQQNTDVGMSR